MRQQTCEVECCHLVGRELGEKALHPVEDEGGALQDIDLILASAEMNMYIIIMLYLEFLHPSNIQRHIGTGTSL